MGNAHLMKACGAVEVLLHTHFFNVDTTYRRVISLTALPLYPRYRLDRRLKCAPELDYMLCRKKYLASVGIYHSITGNNKSCK